MPYIEYPNVVPYRMPVINWLVIESLVKSGFLPKYRQPELEPVTVFPNMSKTGPKP